MEKLINILERIKPGVNYSNTTNLASSGILDSLSIIELIEEIENEYSIEVSMDEFILENFESATKIYDMIQRLK